MPNRRALFYLLKRFIALSGVCLIYSSGFGQTPVSVAKPVIDSNLASFRFTGTITSDREAGLSPRVAGLVSKANAEMGFSAKEGDLLVSLDDTLARMDLEEKQLNLEAAKEELANAKRRLDEAIDLGDANFPRSERENRETTYRTAEISVRRMQTVLETQKEIVERHRIIAPFDGVVVEKNAEVGEWVQTGNPVLRFVDTHNLRLDLQIPQEQLDVILRSKTVMVYLPGANGKPFEAHIEARSPMIDFKNRTFQVRVRLDKPPTYVKPGMSAEAVFQPPSSGSSLLISRDAILRSGESDVNVWVTKQIGQNITATKRTVKLGTSSGDYIQVLKGLDSSDLVIFQGNESLQEGQSIRIVDSVIPTMNR